jgi:hypothetical protein
LLEETDGLDERVSMYCSTEPWLSFMVSLNVKEALDSKFLQHLNENYDRIISYSTPLYVSLGDEKISNDSEIRIINSNTKARRLGYIKILAAMLNLKKQISRLKLSRNFEDYSQVFNGQLLAYKNDKGRVKPTKSGISALPYIEISEQFNLIANTHNLSTASKSLKVYNVIKEQNESSTNIFFMDRFDRVFFIENILRYDFLYIIILMEIIYVDNGLSINLIREVFREKVVDRLLKIEGNLNFAQNSKEKKAIQIIRNRIVEWTKPEVYLEHVLLPRINWLYDLELINLNQANHISITQFGSRFFEHLLEWQDVYRQEIGSANEMINMYLVHIVSDTYNNKYTNSIDSEEIDDKIKSYIFDSFNFFKTIAPNRVTSSQAFFFTKYMLYLKDSVLVGETYIKRIMIEKFSSIFVYKYQTQYRDGYIQIIQ